MFGLYRRCGISKDNISVNCRDNGSNLNTFTNSSNISTIPSSILYNRTNRSKTGKIMNVLLFLVFGSSVVSFGMKYVKEEIIGGKRKSEGNNVNDNYCTSYNSYFYYKLLGFIVSSALSGIGGENILAGIHGKTLSWNVYRSNIFTSFCINAQITLPMPLPLIGRNLNIHVVGVNFLSLILGTLIAKFLCDNDSLYNEKYGIIGFCIRSCANGIRYGVTKTPKHVCFAGSILFDTIQFLSLSIPVMRYYSINVNIGSFFMQTIFYFLNKNKLISINKNKLISTIEENRPISIKLLDYVDSSDRYYIIARKDKYKDIRVKFERDNSNNTSNIKLSKDSLNKITSLAKYRNKSKSLL